MSRKLLLLLLTASAFTVTAKERGVLRAQGVQPPLPPSGWFGGPSVIGVIRPSNWYWFLTTPTGGCPPGFLAGTNSDNTPLCYTQFGLPGDYALPLYPSGSPLLAPAVVRFSDGRLYFLAASGRCPAGAANLGRLATGFVYCSMPTIVRAGTTPFAYQGTTVGAWDPARLTFSIPYPGGYCPRGMTYSAGLCTLRWGHAAIRPQLLNFDASRGVIADDFGFYDPASRAHYFVPSGGTCPRGSFYNGAVNGVASCVIPATPGEPLTPTDFDGDGIPDAAAYSVATHRFSLAPSSNVCPWFWTIGSPDGYGRVTCSRQLGSAGDVAVDGGDYDNDGRADLAVSSNDTYLWTILPSSGVCPVTTTTQVAEGRVQCTRQFGLPLDIRIH